METLIIPEETKIIPEQKVDVDLYQELQKPLYFCPGIGGVIRDIKWVAEAVEQSRISFNPGELTTALTEMIKNGLVRVVGSGDTAGNWSVGFTLVSRH